MEDTLLNVFFVVVSLLLSKEYNVFHDQDDNIIVGMRDHEHLLLHEGARLENGEHSVTTELPHSNQEASQSHHKRPRGEGDTSDVKQMMPNVRTTVLHEEQMSPVGDQNNFRQKAFSPDDQEKLDIATDTWTLHMSKTGQVDVEPSGTNVDQNFAQGDEELSGKLKKGQVETHHGKPDDLASSIDQENTYTWYLWKTFSFISLIHFLKWIRKLDFKPQPRTLLFLNGKKVPKSFNICTKISHLDYKTITSFYHQCVQVPASNSWQICVFVEGFVNDLLETVRNVSTKGPDMKIGDFVGVGSLYEQCASKKSIVCDIHVPIIPQRPYSFEFELLSRRTGSSSTLYSRVKMVKGTSSSICLCSNSNLDDDMLCLLHPDKIKDDVVKDYIDGPLCQENSPHLSQKRVVKWFRSAMRNAWDEISHKYDFELIFRNGESPGSLKVRFRSGKVILFNITPVVQFQDSEAHLLSYLPLSGHLSDTHWPLCFARYENALLQHLTETLPDNSCHIRCLQILSFLHKHQVGLTENCGLTSYHLKNTLLHLLLVNKPSSWQPEQIGQRLNDMLMFFQQRFKSKVLHHALVGNPLTPSNFVFPKEFREGKQINLFLPLLSNEELYFKTEKHLVEMIRNAPVLIYEYSTK